MHLLWSTACAYLIGKLLHLQEGTVSHKAAEISCWIVEQAVAENCKFYPLVVVASFWRCFLTNFVVIPTIYSPSITWNTFVVFLSAVAKAHRRSLAPIGCLRRGICEVYLFNECEFLYLCLYVGIRLYICVTYNLAGKLQAISYVLYGWLSDLCT